MPEVGVSELVAALHRRRERRRESVAALQASLRQLGGGVEQHLARIARLKEVVQAQGGDLKALRHYDSLMARLRAELRSAERSMAAVFSEAAQARVS